MALPSWFEESRAQARARWDSVGFPTTKDEEWKYTNLSAVAHGGFAPAVLPAPLSPGEIAPFDIPGLDGPRLVFVNGSYELKLSRREGIPEGVWAGSLACALELEGERIREEFGRVASIEANPLVALSAARAADGAFVHIPAGLSLDAPIHLLFIAAPDTMGPISIHPRNLILAGEGSRARVIEEYRALGAGAYFTNPVTEIVVGPGADLVHAKIQDEAAEAYHVGAVAARQERGSRFVSFSISLGARIARTDIGARVADENCESHLNGLYLADGQRHVDHHTVVDHAKPHCRSDELYKGILGDSSRGVFNGKIFVRKDAQKTDAIQSNKALLLSKKARIDTKPQLEIFADDVRCTHGATVGQLDDKSLFYLRARGIPEGEARKILTQAFARDVLDRIEIEPLREHIAARVMARLPS